MLQLPRFKDEVPQAAMQPQYRERYHLPPAKAVASALTTQISSTVHSPHAPLKSVERAPKRSIHMQRANGAFGEKVLMASVSRISLRQ